MVVAGGEKSLIAPVAFKKEQRPLLRLNFHHSRNGNSYEPQAERNEKYFKTKLHSYTAAVKIEDEGSFSQQASSSNVVLSNTPSLEHDPILEY